jgi:uncharacterized protein YgiM (DUF1202 family)
VIRTGIQWSIFLIFFSLATVLRAETVYVTDMLRLNMHEKPNSEGKLIMSASSGTALQILERTRGFARVKAPDGSVGWVKSAYLVPDKPARLVVDTMKANMEKALSDSAKLRQELENLQSESSRLESSSRQSESMLLTSQKKLKEIQLKNTELQQLIDGYGTSVPISIYLGSILLCLLFGIALGWFWLDHKIRKRHGGFRIY